jgi:DNA polymerase-3 subunit gamma/tau
MSHQVLARKWRPRDFESLVGQEHVVRALSHALETGRLHHAYLFTGTRGVGKTTIARILAKSLNCEAGQGAHPCGRCRACTEIDEGRFPDYLELDAASNRGVEEMVQLLENAVYSPVSGRFKVYVIDEVHMLSTHAFNAMLKTLEEPPPHVVFILATTDPQKVPVTVLSRCLQFNLKNMPPAAIAGHLAHVLQAEGIPAESPALALIGRAAAGSMRDALSLLDQAIAFSAGRVDESAVREMLGVVDRRHLGQLLEALVAGDGPALVGVADSMLAGNAPFGRTLADLAALLHRIALAQVGVLGDEDDPETLQRHAREIPAEDLQVWYQIAIHGARDLPLAPDEHTGFTMTLLRLLAFRPGEAPAQSAARAPTGRTAQPGAARQPVPQQSPPRQSAPQPSAPQPSAPPQRVPQQPAPPQPAAPAAEQAPPAPARGFDGDWPALAAALQLGGFAQQFMQQSELIEADGLSFRVRVPIRPLAEPGTVARVRDALAAHFGAPVRLSAEVGAVAGQTAAAVASQQRSERLQQAQEAMESDPFVQTLITDFGGRIIPGSVRPNES